MPFLRAELGVIWDHITDHGRVLPAEMLCTELLKEELECSYSLLWSQALGARAQCPWRAESLWKAVLFGLEDDCIYSPRDAKGRRKKEQTLIL